MCEVVCGVRSCTTVSRNSLSGEMRISFLPARMRKNSRSLVGSRSRTTERAFSVSFFISLAHFAVASSSMRFDFRSGCPSELTMSASETPGCLRIRSHVALASATHFYFILVYTTPMRNPTMCAAQSLALVRNGRSHGHNHWLKLIVVVVLATSRRPDILVFSPLESFRQYLPHSLDLALEA